MNLRTMAFAAIATVAFGTSGVSFAQTAPAPAGTPPPPPVPIETSSPLISTSPEPSAPPSVPSSEPAPAASATTPTPVPFESPSALPTATPTPGGRHRGRHPSSEPSPDASPSETPEPPQFSTLDGVWEVALQPLTGARTIYSHLYVTQKGDTLTGKWRRGDGKKALELPFTGTFDGRLFKLTIVNGALTEVLSGYEENFSDMVGLYTTGDAKKAGIPFTAAHRKSTRERERDEDNRAPEPRHPSANPGPPGSGPPQQR